MWVYNMDFVKLKTRIKELAGIQPRTFYTNEEGNIEYYNWCRGCYIGREWFYDFLKNIGMSDKKLSFYSVFGKSTYLKRHSSKTNIFFSGENLHYPMESYKNYCLNSVGLAMGFDERPDENYMRFPLWLIYMFEPEVNLEKIKQRVREINQIRNTKKYDCVLISSHDKRKSRRAIYHALENMMDVRCAGKLLHNTDELWNEYKNDKVKYVNEFKFNICPENDDVFGYVTEKVFEAFAAGSVPIYAGSKNNPEPGLINKDTIIFWNLKGDNSKTVKFIRELHENEKLYDEFVSQERLKPEIADYAYEKFCDLRDRFANL